MDMIAKLMMLVNVFKKHSSIFIEYFFMMLGIGMAVLLILKILTWLF